MIFILTNSQPTYTKISCLVSIYQWYNIIQQYCDSLTLFAMGEGVIYYPSKFGLKYEKDLQLGMLFGYFIYKNICPDNWWWHHIVCWQIFADISIFYSEVGIFLWKSGKFSLNTGKCDVVVLVLAINRLKS